MGGAIATPPPESVGGASPGERGTIDLEDSAPSNYLGLFPENMQSSDSGDHEQEVGVVDPSYLEEVNEQLIEHHLSDLDPRGHTHQLDNEFVDNEFAELDPFLAMSGESSDQGAPPTNDLGAGVEVGVDATDEIGPAAIEGEEPSSPMESVLYSHSHY